MNLAKHIIIINGDNKTSQVESIKPDGHQYAIKFLNSDKTYRYSRNNVLWLTNPLTVDIENCHIYVNGRRANNVTSIHLFAGDTKKFYAVRYANGSVRHLPENDIDIKRSCIVGKATDVFDYMQQCAGVSTLGADEVDSSSEGLLSAIYSNIDFVDDKTAAAIYLDSHRDIKKNKIGTILFPFGCNASQERAVKAALSNQISVIQGPPGTGKTQTILNIIANLLVDEKSILVVSNNNSATENVLEKLSKNGLAFLVAPLGNRENKEAFIANQPPLNPELPSWSKSRTELRRASSEAKVSLEKVESVFEMQERLAICRQELAEVEAEKKHYKQEYAEDLSEQKIKTSSSKILKIAQRLKNYANKYPAETTGMMKRLRRKHDKLSIELHIRLSMKIRQSLSHESVPMLISRLDWLFYIRKIEELKQEIDNLENHLSRFNASALMKSLTDNSMTILKARIAQKYKNKRETIASVKDLFNNADEVLDNYPIVLSTTFSSKTCFNSDTIFDYVIMDEASQVSVETGLLALTCAKNAVIVGDTMQLPNVITDEDKLKLDEIRKSFEIPDSYDAAKHSFLSSVLATRPTVTETLLREHYRCHPDIINFCNQKFYGGNLLIMTKRDDDEKHLLALTTAPGQHCRGHYNQREIDAVKIELLPLLQNQEETGIIAPYNKQVDQFHAQIPNVEAATVHKYQGREKDVIIMSVTDDVITEFADNANLLNVAVSRAKDKFCLVVTGNPQELKGNIHDLLKYIRYQQGTIIQSRLRSIFDYLSSHVEQFRRENESEYESENLTYNLIEKIRTAYPHLSHIKALRNYPLRYLICDTSALSEREAKYALHPSTHIDFLIINRVTKEPLLAIETDGYSFHNEQTEQFKRDCMKDKILENYGLPLLRLSTVGHSEEQRIVSALSDF
ncbi:MAG: AAA domain-containing protein [Muribaculaceae bacterium]|nr:AAA domain-containing protein [Muribaculaceae bacterium]